MTLTDSNPKITVRLFKTISRGTVDGVSAVSMRYAGKDSYIDLTEYLGDNSSVRTTKSVREPAGGFSITIPDRPYDDGFSLETIYGLIEPMDGIEIRMWGGVGMAPPELPIVMRGFVSDIYRSQSMGENGHPQRSITIAGQDYGKIWQMFQIIYLQAYSEGKSLLTTYNLWELFGMKAQNTMKVSEFVKAAVEKILNPFLDKMLPKHWPMPRSIKTTDMLVQHGVINNSYQNTQGSIYDMLRQNTDVPTWNELYIEDREDGVHCVFRPIPALRYTPDKDGKVKIMDDAPDPMIVEIFDDDIVAMQATRSDSTVANFYWVNNTRYDLIDEMQRKLASIPNGDKRVSAADYPNAAVKYYGTRAMYAETQLAADEVKNAGSGQSKSQIDDNNKKVEAWIDKRRRELMEMNKDNVIYETGSVRMKGGQWRPVGGELMKAGDYGRFVSGDFYFDAYITRIDHEFVPYVGYTCTVQYERGEGFANRIGMETSAWLKEQATRY